MRYKWFMAATVAIVIATGYLVIATATQAQRSERGEMERRQGRGSRGGSSGGGLFSFIDHSWVDLTFVVEADDETLVKARAIYEKTRDKFEKSFRTPGEAGSYQGTQEAVTAIREEFKEGLRTVLTEAQIAQLDKLESERLQQFRRRGAGRMNGVEP